MMLHGPKECKLVSCLPFAVPNFGMSVLADVAFLIGDSDDRFVRVRLFLVEIWAVLGE
jgi:hypothetical protein